MAERRMFAKTIIDSDAFLEMPTSAQALYYHIGMRADDDGFSNNPKKIQRMIGAAEDDLKLLFAKKFLLPFESGVVAVKHWKIHNYIRNDRYKETVYQDEKAQLLLKENGAYTELTAPGIPDGNQEVYQMETQVRLGKDRARLELGEGRVGEDNEDSASPPPTRKRFVPPSVEEVRQCCYERGNSVDPQRFVDYYTSNGWMVGKNKMKDWKAAVRTWEQKEKPQGRSPSTKSSNPFLDMLEDGSYE